jgi:hypothetical protein
MRSKRIKQLITLLITGNIIASQANSAPSMPRPSVEWSNIDSSTAIRIDISQLLSAEQREILNSGFSTFTVLAVSEKKLKDPGSQATRRLVCRVKFDTWEEKYTVTRLEPLPVTKFSGDKIESWANQCLSYQLTDVKLIKQLTNGGSLFLNLMVRQSSLDESSKIKDWLVKQQSGLMQGLYSHMLGDLQLGGRIELSIEIPPSPFIKKHQQPITPRSSY